MTGFYATTKESGQAAPPVSPLIILQQLPVAVTADGHTAITPGAKNIWAATSFSEDARAAVAQMGTAIITDIVNAG
jgi:hypothetical protein